MKRKEIKVLTILHWEVVDFNLKKKKNFEFELNCCSDFSPTIPNKGCGCLWA